MKDESKNNLRIGGGKILLLLFFALISGSVWGQTQVTDVLTPSSLELNGGSYSNFSDKMVSSGVMYAGNAMMSSSGAIQMRSTNSNSGIVTTSTEGVVKSIIITWGEETIQDRVLVVYGKNTAYTSAEDLYGTSTKQGISLGELVYTSSSESMVSRIDVSDEYRYIGFRSKSGALYISQIDIVWELPFNVEAPVLKSSAGLTFSESTTITVDADDEALVYYTLNGETPTVSSDLFPKEGLTITSTTTIKAIAVKDGETSPVVTATYTQIVPIPADILMGIVCEKDGLWYAAMNELSSGTLKAVLVDVVNGKIINDAPEDGMGWYVDETAMTIKTASEQYLAVAGGKSTNLKFQTSKSVWSYDDMNACWYQLDNTTKRTLLYSGGTNGFKAYAVSNINVSGYSAAMQFMPFTDGYVREVAGASVEAPRYGTICLPCDVAAEDFSGAEFYSVLGKVMTGDEVTAIALSEPLTELKAGTPYIFSATDEKLLIAYTGEAVEEAKTANGLIGSLSDRLDVPEGKHLLTNNTVQICGTGCYIASNRAYVDFDQMEVYVPMAGVNTRLISFEGVTAVRERQIQAETKVDVYSVDGVCIRRQVDMPEAVSGLSKGLYIVNGKKMTVN